jgi:uncharacterized protein
MEIFIDDIPEEGLTVDASEGEPWLARVIEESFGSFFVKGDHAALSLKLFTFEGHVTIEGTLRMSSHPQCDRCLASYQDASEVRLYRVLAPLYQSRREEERMAVADRDLVKEDLDFGYYEGDRFDLDDVVREQIVLAKPMKHLCRDDCCGLCPRCGRDLNAGACACPPEEHHGPFDALRDLKLKAAPTSKSKR